MEIAIVPGERRFNRRWKRFRVCAAILALGFLAVQIGTIRSVAQPALPPAPARMLNAFHFNDTNWLGLWGNAPRAASGLDLVSSWEQNAVRVAATNSLLQYNAAETNGLTNIFCDNGSVFLWFLPDWNSASAGGTGPGVYGRLIEVGSYTTNASIGWWSMFLDPAGTNLFLSAQTNGAGATFLTASVTFTTNSWTHLALTYSPSNSFLYTNGSLCATGFGVAYYPSPAVVASNGFCIGGGLFSDNVAKGSFEWLRFYDSDVGADWVSNYYQTVLATYGDGGGTMLSGSMGEFVGSCVTNGPVYLTNLACAYDAGVGWTVSFTIAGGTNGVVYDMFTTTNLAGDNITNSQWSWIGQGSTCYRYTLTNQPNSQAFFVLGDSSVDPDHDGLSTSFERLVSKTDPGSPSTPDTDGDGMLDAWEVFFGTLPTADDSAIPAQRTNYSYDGAGRLLQVSGKRTETFTVDGEGNVKTAQ